MITESVQSSNCWTRNTQRDADAYREDFLRLLARLQMERAQAIGLVEAATGRPFESCSPMDLVPVLRQLLDVLHSQRTPVEADQPWHV
jgi:hypothetical protein